MSDERRGSFILTPDAHKAIVRDVLDEAKDWFVGKEIYVQREEEVENNFRRGEKKMEKMDNRLWALVVMAIIQLVGIVTVLFGMLQNAQHAVGG